MDQTDLRDLALSKHISRLFSAPMHAELVRRLIRNAYEAGYAKACNDLDNLGDPHNAHYLGKAANALRLKRDLALVEYFTAGHLDPDPLADKILKGNIDDRTLAIVHAAAVSLTKPKPIRRK
jgi:hypothetical protein